MKKLYSRLKNNRIIYSMIAVFVVAMFLTNVKYVSAEEMETAAAPVVYKLHAFTGSKGFNPSQGNALRFRASIDCQTDYREIVSYRFRIYNSSGKWVYQRSGKTYNAVMFDLNWSGKPTSTNQAGLSSKKYVENGTYRAELSVYSGAIDQSPCTIRNATFKVSSAAKKGEKGIASAKKVPIYTGFAAVDYMAEKMVKAAGVKSSMSADKKVKKIYTWMTKNIKHKHYYEMRSSDKTYYNLKKNAATIAAFKAQNDAKVASGKMIYSYWYGGEDFNMDHRYGVCDDTTAIFVILCHHVGVDAGNCGGYYKNRSGKKSPHAWPYAVVNGKKYYYDIDVEIQNMKKISNHYYWYKKNKSQAKKTHQFGFEYSPIK